MSRGHLVCWMHRLMPCSAQESVDRGALTSHCKCPSEQIFCSTYETCWARHPSFVENLYHEHFTGPSKWNPARHKVLTPYLLVCIPQWWADSPLVERLVVFIHGLKEHSPCLHECLRIIPSPLLEASALRKTTQTRERSGGGNATGKSTPGAWQICFEWIWHTADQYRRWFCLTEPRRESLLGSPVSTPLGDP